MKITLRRTRPDGTNPEGFVRRLARQLGGGLVPAPVLAPVGVSLPRADYQPDRFHPVFGRRRDEAPRSEEESDGAGPDEEESTVPPGDDAVAPLPPSAQPPEEVESEEVDEAEAAGGSSPVESSWSGYEPPAAEPSPFSFDAGGERQDLPAWTPSPLTESAFPTYPPEPEEASPAAPWAAESSPEVVSFPGGEYQEQASPEATWPAAEGETPVWSPPESAAADEAEPELAEAVAEPEPEFAAAESEVAAEEISEEPLAEVPEEGPTAAEVADEAPEPAAYVGEAEPAWAAEPEPEAAEPAYVGFVQEGEVAKYAGAVALVEDARAFPLPDGEVLFRNLRAGFTDPARLLRHLAGEGHTGVLHVAAVDARNTYVVLVDGYVVAVASDSQGRLTTTNRVSFPNFPNSQDILNVITYPREIARGLGLLLHAPVHFRGLGAMFVNLDGLRSYLSKHSACGGMVVASDSGTGVALFDDGRLVGAYSESQVVETDLSPLRELIKDLDAEIDVRFGGPKDLDPIPLDTLLAGYPL